VGGDGTFDNPGLLSPTYTPGALDLSNVAVELSLVVAPQNPCVALQSDKMVIDLFDSPVIYAGADATICENSTFTLSDATASGTGSIVFTWSTSGDGTFSNSQIINPTYTPGANDIASSDVELILDVSDDHCSNTDSKMLHIVSYPIVNAGSDAIICEGESYTVTDASIAGSFAAFVWVGGDGIFDNPGLLAPTYYPGTNDILNGSVVLTLYVIPTNPCQATQISTINLSIQNLPLVIAGTYQEVCEGTEVQLDATALNFRSILWSGGSGFFDDATKLDAIYTPGISETGYVVLFIEVQPISPCLIAADDYVELYIQSNPSVDAGQDQVICEGSYLELEASATHVSSAIWSGGLGSFNDSFAFDAMYVPAPSEYGTTVTLCIQVQPISPCVATASDCMDVFIQPNPTVDAGPDMTVCGDGSGIILMGNSSNSSNCFWNLPPGGGFSPDPFNTFTTYYPSWEEIANGAVVLCLICEPIAPCSMYAEDCMTITFIQEPYVDAGADQEICDTETVLLSAVVANYSSLLWSSAGDGFFFDEFEATTEYVPGAADIFAGAVDLCLTVESISPCETFQSDCLDLFIQPNPVADAGDDLAIAKDGFAQLSGVGQHFDFITWFTSGDGFFSDMNDMNAIYYPGPLDIETNEVDIFLEAIPLYPCGVVTFDALKIFIGNEQVIHLQNGWNGLSSYLTPFIPEISKVVTPIADDLIVIQDFTQLYWPGYNINTIGNFDQNKGYAVKVSDYALLPIIGTEAENTSFTFESGWNIFPILSACPVPVFELLVEMGSGFVIAYEIGGSGVLWPAQGIYGILQFEPGKSYMLKTNQSSNFTFPGCDEILKTTVPPNPVVKPIANSPWKIPAGHPGYHIIGFPMDAVENIFSKGDLIGVFTPEGFCAGVVEYQEAPFALPVNANDLTTSEKDGFNENEILSFKMFSIASNSIKQIDLVFDENFSDGGFFEINGVSVVKGILIDNEETLTSFFSSMEVYPNPSKGIVTISGLPANQMLDLEVLDTKGRLIFKTTIGNATTIDLSDKPGGVYFLKFKSEKEILLRKLVID
jgi:hypothetical protein